MPPDAMRDLLWRTGHIDLTRLDDYQVRGAACRLITSGASLRTLSDVRTLLDYSSGSPAGDRIGLRQLVDRAIDLLDFKVEPGKGLIYAGQYGTYQGLWKPPDDRLTEEIRAAERLPSGAADKTTIAHTPGGKWLLGWKLRSFLGGGGEDAAWAHATARFIAALSGEVEVLLPFSEFDRTMRELPWHPLYEVPGVTRVLYYLDDNARRIQNPPKELFGAGVVKKAYDRQLIFRASIVG